MGIETGKSKGGKGRRENGIGERGEREIKVTEREGSGTQRRKGKRKKGEKGTEMGKWYRKGKKEMG